LFLGHAHEQAVSRDAGVVHQNVDAAGVGQNFFGCRFDGLRVGDIQCDGPAFTSRGAHFVGDFFGIFSGARNTDDISAFSGKFQRDGAADSATGSSDNGDLVIKLTHKSPSFPGPRCGCKARIPNFAAAFCEVVRERVQACLHLARV